MGKCAAALVYMFGARLAYGYRQRQQEAQSKGEINKALPQQYDEMLSKLEEKAAQAELEIQKMSEHYESKFSELEGELEALRAERAKLFVVTTEKPIAKVKSL
ncbi:PREDICTED: uncharacterized protein LOC109237767 [Nicotiana attenuata]|uniref:Uncharacterized protein n=1 Tax=Nicotiana attenuata TaxID=49451 RepID=A0A314LDF4_NICAT|nr:PREDICTED: uncharacterized protein LOC109237767 [Nicotiana attenuata]XP_019259678.1 PREDICTED: uncharacterized protein LOC109237767 [Nicotiana attenuata]OIT39678.1 hypothetical protein A4A49_08497 [Nicotiana attenuata]